MVQKWVEESFEVSLRVPALASASAWEWRDPTIRAPSPFDNSQWSGVFRANDGQEIFGYNLVWMRTRSDGGVTSTYANGTLSNPLDPLNRGAGGVPQFLTGFLQWENPGTKLSWEAGDIRGHGK